MGFIEFLQLWARGLRLDTFTDASRCVVQSSLGLNDVPLARAGSEGKTFFCLKCQNMRITDQKVTNSLQ
jgi:hypothetical protein